MSAEDLIDVKECLGELKRATRGLGPQWRVKPFGGIANGFATRGSDLDVTCYIEGMEASYTWLATQELQTRLLPILQTHPRFEVMDQVWTARVPILKLRFDGVLEVDLSCHNTEALPNTHLLRAYGELSPEVRELGLLIKLWAKAEGVIGAPRGHLSSYALTLMAIYYMQVDPEVSMPRLPTEQFVGKAPESLRDRVSWSCPWPSHVLFARFFRFYADEFQWGSEVVSVRHGRRSRSDDPVYDQLRATLSHRIHIEDPFLTGRNLHCVLGPMQEWALYLAICRGASNVQCGSLPLGLARGVPPVSRERAARRSPKAKANKFGDRAAADVAGSENIGDSSSKSQQSPSESTKSPPYSDSGGDERHHGQGPEGTATEDSEGGPM